MIYLCCVIMWVISSLVWSEAQVRFRFFPIEGEGIYATYFFLEILVVFGCLVFFSIEVISNNGITSSIFASVFRYYCHRDH